MLSWFQLKVLKNSTKLISYFLRKIYIPALVKLNGWQSMCTMPSEWHGATLKFSKLYFISTKSDYAQVYREICTEYDQESLLFVKSKMLVKEVKVGNIWGLSLMIVYKD